MTPTQTVLAFAAGLALITLAGPVLAEGGCWDDCGPADQPEPPPTVQPPTRTGSDRDDPLPQSRPLPCCVRDGQLVTTPGLFMSHERALKVCQRAMATGAALIYSCDDKVGSLK